MNNLTRRAMIGLGNLLFILVLLLFLPAGSLDYWEGWLFILVFFSSVLAITLYFPKKDPDSLKTGSGPALPPRRNKARKGSSRSPGSFSSQVPTIAWAGPMSRSLS